MPIAITDADVKRLLKRLEQGEVVTWYPKRLVRDPDGTERRGSPGMIARGETLVGLPEQDEPRELEVYELEALIELGIAGELKFAVLVAPAIGRHATREILPDFRLEDGRLLGPTDPDYPAAAFEAGPGEG